MNMKNRPVFRLLMFLASVTFFSSCSGGSSSPTPVTIDLSDATALFQVSQSNSSGLALKDTSSEEALGQLRKILSDGTVQPVILDDTGTAADVSLFNVFVGPDDKVYIAFGDRGVLINGEQCYLVRGPVGGLLDCIGPNAFGTEDSGYSPFSFQRPESSFDSANNLYFYDLAVPDDGISCCDAVIRSLSTEGTVTERLRYSEAEVELDEGFAVGPDGTLFFTGRALSTNQRFFRRTTSEGGVATMPVDAAESADFIVSSGGDLFVSSSGVVRLLQSSGWETVETISWPDTSGLVTAGGYGFGRGDLDTGDLMEDNSGSIYLVGSLIYRMYPGDLVAVTASDNTVVIARTANNLLYYSGTDASNTNIFRRVDLTDETFPETDLLNGEDIEVYRFQVWSNGNILFGGLRLSDNQLILGEINGDTLELTVRTTTTTRIDELVLL